MLRIDGAFRPVGASTGQRQAQWQVASNSLHGQLVKRKGQAQFALMRMARGTRAALSAVLKAQGFKTLIQTAFVERVNLTPRRGVAPLMQKTWAHAQTTVHLTLHVEWWRAYYHYIRPHESLAQKISGLRRQRLRSPGMAAGLTGRLWTVGELLHLPPWPEKEPGEIVSPGGLGVAGGGVNQKMRLERRSWPNSARMGCCEG